MKIKTQYLFLIIFTFFLLGCHGQVNLSSDNNNNSLNIGNNPSPNVNLNNPITYQNKTIISWTAPFTRVDGTDFYPYQIDHYIIKHTYQGHTDYIRINDYSAQQYTFYNLASGVHYFSIKVVDIDGFSSNYSDTVSKIIP